MLGHWDAESLRSLRAKKKCFVNAEVMIDSAMGCVIANQTEKTQQIARFVDPTNVRIKKVSGWWFGTFFQYIGNVIIPTDFHSIIFQRGWWLNHQPAHVLTND